MGIYHNQIFAEYEERLIRRRRDPHTIRLFQYAAKKFEEHLEGSITDPIAVEQAFMSIPLSRGTRRGILQHVRGACIYAHRRGILDCDPTLDVELERPVDKQPVTIPADELRQIALECRSDYDLLRLRLFTHTGMRRHEVAGLHWESVNLKKRTMQVVGKQKKLRTVPIHPALGELLADRKYHMGQPVVRWVRLEWLHLIAPERTFHDFRRTFATSLRRNGAQKEVIERICGWAPRGIMGRYYDEVAEDEMHRAILLAYQDDPI